MASFQQYSSDFGSQSLFVSKKDLLKVQKGGKELIFGKWQIVIINFILQIFLSLFYFEKKSN